MVEKIKTIRQTGFVLLILLIFSISVHESTREINNKLEWLVVYAVTQFFIEKDGVEPRINEVTESDSIQPHKKVIRNFMNNSRYEGSLGTVVSAIENNEKRSDINEVSMESVFFGMTVNMSFLSTSIPTDDNHIMLIYSKYPSILFVLELSKHISLKQLNNSETKVSAGELNELSLKRLGELKTNIKNIYAYTENHRYIESDFEDYSYHQQQGALLGLSKYKAEEGFFGLAREVLTNSLSIPFINYKAKMNIGLIWVQVASVALIVFICSLFRQVYAYATLSDHSNWLLKSWVIKTDSFADMPIRIFEWVVGVLGYMLVCISPAYISWVVLDVSIAFGEAWHFYISMTLLVISTILTFISFRYVYLIVKKTVKPNAISVVAD